LYGVNKKKLHVIIFAILLYSTSLPEGSECYGKIFTKVGSGGKKIRHKKDGKLERKMEFE
jgi:hypothetical protein